MNYVPLYTPPPPTVAQSLIRMSYGRTLPIANPKLSPSFSFVVPDDPPLTAAYHRHIACMRARKPSRRERYRMIRRAILRRTNRRTEAGCRRRGIDYPPF